MDDSTAFHEALPSQVDAGNRVAYGGGHTNESCDFRIDYAGLRLRIWPLPTVLPVAVQLMES